MIQTEFWILDRRRYFDQSTQALAWTISTPVNYMAHQIEHVLVRATQPVLQGHEIGPYVLCRTGNKAQHLGNTAQHLHLSSTTCCRFFLVAAQFFQQSHGTTGRLVHVELAQAGKLDHFGSRGHADHGVAMLTSGTQIIQDGKKVIFQKEHARNNNVCLGNICPTARNGCFVARILRRSMHRQLQAGDFLEQQSVRALCCTCQVCVHSDNHHTYRCMRCSGFCVSG